MSTRHSKETLRLNGALQDQKNHSLETVGTSAGRMSVGRAVKLRAVGTNCLPHNLLLAEDPDRHGLARPFPLASVDEPHVNQPLFACLFVSVAVKCGPTLHASRRDLPNADPEVNSACLGIAARARATLHLNCPVDPPGVKLRVLYTRRAFRHVVLSTRITLQTAGVSSPKVTINGHRSNTDHDISHQRLPVSC